MMDNNKDKNKPKMAINKYFGPIWIRIKETTDNTIRDIDEINKFNPDKKEINENDFNAVPINERKEQNDEEFDEDVNEKEDEIDKESEKDTQGIR